MKQVCLAVLAALLLTFTVVGSGVAAEQAAQAQVEAVAVNSADVAQLKTLPGIGAATAQRIVDYRTTHGPFAQVTDLQKVKGIGPRTLEKIRPLVTLN